jgi:hypothetical protein
MANVVAYSGVDKSLVEASNRTAIHFVVPTVATVHLGDRGFVTIGIGVCAGTTSSGPQLLGEVETEADL